MKNVLIPVDGSANSLRAVHYMIDHVREHGACNLHLLNVQPPIVSGTVLAFVSSDMIQEYYEDEARTALADARIALDKAGVMYQSGLRVGKIAEAIKAYAAEQQCDHIVMGSRGLGAAGASCSGRWRSSCCISSISPSCWSTRTGAGNWPGQTRGSHDFRAVQQ